MASSGYSIRIREALTVVIMASARPNVKPLTNCIALKVFGSWTSEPRPLLRRDRMRVITPARIVFLLPKTDAYLLVTKEPSIEATFYMAIIKPTSFESRVGWCWTIKTGSIVEVAIGDK